MSSSVAVAPVSAADPASTPDDWWLLDRLALAWSALSALSLYLLIGRGGWYVDDFLNFGLAKRYPLDGHYLTYPIFGHLQPGTRLVNWLLYRLSPMNYPLASGLLCVLVGVLTWLVYRILRSAFRPSPWHLLLTAMVSTTGLWVPVLGWWAGGGEIAWCALAGLLTTQALLRCADGGRRLVWGPLAGVWLLVGLAFYERALFGAAFGCWFVLAVRCRSARLAELARVLRRIWPGYLALSLVAAGYLAYYRSHQLAQPKAGYSQAELLHFFWICWSHALIPGLFGGSLRTRHSVVLSVAHPPLWWLTACQLVLLGLVGYGVYRSRLRAVLAWLVFLAVFLLAQYSVAIYRLADYQPRGGEEFRYVADLLPLLVLTVGLTVLRPATLDPDDTSPDVAEPGLARRPWIDRWRAVDRRQLAGAGVALLALVAVYLTTALPVARLWVDSRHVSYVRNLRASVAALDRQGSWSLYTTYTPGDVSPAGYGHYSQTPVVARLITDRPVSADDLTKPMYVADSEGRLRPATLRAGATVPTTCVAAGQKLLRPLSRPVPTGLWNLQLSYRVAAPTVLRFALDPGTGKLVEATGNYRAFPVSGAGRLTFAIRPAAIGALRLESSAAEACLTDLTIGTPTPTN